MPRRTPVEPDPLLENSLLHRHLGDRRFVLTLPRAVTLQILHPAIAAALASHTRTGLWEHKKRAVSTMITIAYSRRDLRSVIRVGHEHVKGRDNLGRRYHALNPEIFFFQHATYVDALFTSIDTFSTPLSAPQRERLYLECLAWYRRYGISTRGVPTTWSEFTTYFDQACDGLLRRTAHGDHLVSQALRPDAWTPKWLPEGAVRALSHDRARDLLDIDVSAADRAVLSVYARTVRAGAALAPRRMRRLPQARTPDNGQLTLSD